MLDAYCWPQSVDPGDDVSLHASSDASAFEVEVAREGATREVVWRGTGTADNHATPDGASANGCGWPTTMTIPADVAWRSGYYSVVLRAGDERADAYFVIRGRGAPILFVLSTATWNAYNDWGGP